MIRYLLSVLFSLALFCSQASAGFLLNSFSLGSLPVITFLQCSTSNPTGSNPYTFASQNVGAATSDRYILIGFGTEDGSSTFSAVSSTIAGSGTTAVVDEGGTRSASASMFIAALPTGTSADVVVTMSEAITNSSVCLWSITGLSSASATDTATGNSNTGGATITLDIDLLANGVGAAVCGETGTGVTFSWSGFSEREDGTATGMNRTASDYTATVAEAAKAVSVVRTGSGATGCVAATFR